MLAAFARANDLVHVSGVGNIPSRAMPHNVREMWIWMPNTELKADANRTNVNTSLGSHGTACCITSVNGSGLALSFSGVMTQSVATMISMLRSATMTKLHPKARGKSRCGSSASSAWDAMVSKPPKLNTTKTPPVMTAETHDEKSAKVGASTCGKAVQSIVQRSDRADGIKATATITTNKPPSSTAAQIARTLDVSSRPQRLSTKQTNKRTTHVTSTAGEPSSAAIPTHLQRVSAAPSVVPAPANM
mmetsp:Transcript_50467/g.100425  ORF Transcript_50467/g.100425 Transcript_50467/m.100425 type:complete len:246 (+) Transcript_50467:710-1447(+)